MTTDERRQRILHIIQMRKSVSTDELIRQFSVSGMTIRRDLAFMTQRGLITRTYGRVYLAGEHQAESTFDARVIENLPGKQAIASIALTPLRNCNTVFLDGSTTCNELAKLIPPDHSITVYTNSVASLLLLRTMPQVRIFMICGYLASDQNTLDGQTSLSVAKEIFVDAAFVSCSGFSRSGIVNSGISGSELKSIMLANAQQRFLLADHTKYNSRGLFDLSDWRSIDTLITDIPLAPDMADFLRIAGVKVLTGKEGFCPADR